MSDTAELDEGKNLLPKSLQINPLDLFATAEAEGRPLYASAPMVRYSKLAFRETVAQYGVDLTWTPMILAKEFNRSLFARDSDFTYSPSSPPTIAQFGCNSAHELYNATTMIAPYVNGVDINCGCPQSWACAETLGAALMHKRELVGSMVSSAKSALADLGYGHKSVSVKIRVHRDLRDTMDFVRTVQDAGVDFLTIHGRLRSTPSSQPVDLEAVRLVAEHVTCRTLSNGDIFTLKDVDEHVARTGVDGVMAARGILQNPGLFGAHHDDACTWDVVETFMNEVVRAPIPFKLVVHHLTEMCGTDHSQCGKTLLTKEERRQLMACGSMIELMDFLDDAREIKRLRDINPSEKRRQNRMYV